MILANAANPIKNLVFDGVRVKNPGRKPWGEKYYYCENVEGGVAMGDTWPVPPCFSSPRASGSNSITPGDEVLMI